MMNRAIRAMELVCMVAGGLVRGKVRIVTGSREVRRQGARSRGRRRLQQEGIGEVLEGGIRCALDHCRLESKCSFGNQFEFCDKVIETVCRRADHAMLVAREREQAGQFDIAEGMHFGEYTVVSHLVVIIVFLPSRTTSRLKKRPLGRPTSWDFVQVDKLLCGEVNVRPVSAGERMTRTCHLQAIGNPNGTQSNSIMQRI